MAGVEFEPVPTERHQRFRVHLDDGAVTTLHVGRFTPASTAARVMLLTPPRPLLECCTERGIGDAIIGGFFIRAQGIPLGELLSLIHI